MTSEAEPPVPGFLVAAAAAAVAAVALARSPGGPTHPAREPAPPTGTGVSVETDALGAYGCRACHTATAGAAPPLEASRALAAERLAAPDYGGAAGDERSWVVESIVDHCADVVPGWSCEGVQAYGNWLTEDEVDRLAGAVLELARP